MEGLAPEDVSTCTGVRAVMAVEFTEKSGVPDPWKATVPGAERTIPAFVLAVNE